MSKDTEKYPQFFNGGRGLVAILKPNRAFHLKTGDHGKGAGFEFRVYITRRSVLKYRSGKEISFEEFKNILQGTIFKYVKEVNDLLPKGMLDQNNKMLISN